jgi:hypothetical protein
VIEQQAAANPTIDVPGNGPPTAAKKEEKRNTRQRNDVALNTHAASVTHTSPLEVVDDDIVSEY